MTAPVPSDVVAAVAALPNSITAGVTTGEIADTVTAYKALQALVPAANAAKSASDLTTGTLPAARIADGSLPLAKLPVDIATQAELDAVAATANTAKATADAAAVTASATPTTPVKTVAGSYTFILTDTDNLMKSTSATPVTWTVPLNSSVAFTVARGSIAGYQGAAGSITFVGAVGVTVNALGGLKTTGGQFARFDLTKTGTNEWLLSIDAAA